WVENRKDRIPILLYHRLISKATAQAGDVVDEEMIYVSYDTAFTEQMQYLKDAGYTTLDMDDYVAIRNGQKQLPDKPVIITLDDGYLSNYLYAYPVLRKFSQKATIFLAPQPNEYTVRSVEGMDSFLTGEQIKEMSANNISIQSHTLTHCILTELQDDEMEYELTESKKQIEQLTGQTVNHIAIPRAGYNNRVRKWVKKTGYATACCNKKGAATGISDPFSLPRIVIERDMTTGDFARCLTPKNSFILKVIGNIKRIPEQIGGAWLAGRVRTFLYRGWAKPLFQTRNLKRILMTLVLVYVLGAVIFTFLFFVRGA
ncbi:MAG: polysaccharide deacetylase family protein, partial [Planctomycetota bacterium]